MQKTALITGAARGIGLTTAKRFAAEGWHVLMLDVLAEQLQTEAAALGGEAIVCDISDPKQVADVFKAISKLDALVNNAGIADFGPILETDFASWRAIMAVNLDGTFLMSHHAAPLLVEGGAIVNITSISGLRASTMRVAYGTSKAAVAHLTLQQAAEFGELGVRVNAVAPGPVETAMAQKVHTPAIRAAYHDAIPLNRYGAEEEIANAIWFLCSDQSTYITGQILAVDGGFEAVGIGLPELRK